MRTNYLYLLNFRTKLYLTSKKKCVAGVDTYRVVGQVPISNKNGVVTSRIIERNGDSRPTEDSDSSKTTSSLVESKRWEVVETSYLILDLENICKVLSRRNRARGPNDTILIWISPLLNSIPIFTVTKQA